MTDPQFTHIALSDVYSTVPRPSWPAGPDRLLLTQCLEFAAANPNLDLDTSHIGGIIQVNGFQAPLVNGRTHDEQALQRQ